MLEGRKFVATTVFPQTPRTSQQHFFGVLPLSLCSMDLTKTNSRSGVSNRKVLTFDLYQVVVTFETSAFGNKIYTRYDNYCLKWFLFAEYPDLHNN